MPAIKFAAPMLAGVRENGLNYNYRLDATHSLQLIAMQSKAKTDCVMVNGYAWRVRALADPRLPNDKFWARHP